MIKENIMLTRICDICGEPMKHGNTMDFSKMQIKMRNADGKFKKLDVCFYCARKIEDYCKRCKRKGDDSNREL